MIKCPQKSNNNDSTKLSFLCAVTARGERTLTEFKLGEGEVKKCFERVNFKLLENLPLDEVGKNVGRYTDASIYMNNNVDSLATCMATKHKCHESLKGDICYIYIYTCNIHISFLSLVSFSRIHGSGSRDRRSNQLKRDQSTSLEKS